MGLAVTLALLAWALHDVDPRELLAHVRRADPWLMLVTVVLATLTFALRTLRWQLFLRDMRGSRFPLLPLWHATAIGAMANNLLPARAGEFARAYAARRRLPVRFSTALASIGVERVFDGLTLVAFMTLAIVSPSFPRQATIGTITISGIAAWAAALFGGALVIAGLVVHRPAPWLALLRRVTHAVLPARLADRITHIAEGLVAGLEVLKSPGRVLGVVVWSIALWLVNAAAFAVCFRAFGLAVPPEGALLLQGIIGFGVALPASPGFVGVFEAATRVTLALYGIDATRAVSYAVAYHVSTFLPITLLGLHSLSGMRLHLAELRAPRAAEQ
ncbi:MAG: lysylphosphatidylglycerol synthase transmembrane domain-containing protein [Gemmatimonadales bacterium]